MSAPERDEKYEQAVGVLLLSGRASTSFLQREMGIGYNAAARLMERAEAEGVVSRPNSVGRREVCATSEADALRFRIEALEARVVAADALADGMNCTTIIAHALGDGAISDAYAWAFEDALTEQCDALAAYRKTQEGEQ